MSYNIMQNSMNKTACPEKDIFAPQKITLHNVLGHWYKGNVFDDVEGDAIGSFDNLIIL